MQLQWRNVDSPDFTPSVRGYEVFSDLLSKAFSGAQQGLDRYDANLDKDANNRLLMRFAGIQDPEVAKAALAALGTDRQAGRFSASTIDAVAGRPGALISQALNQTNLDKTTYDFGREKGFDTARDAAAPLLNDRMLAYAAGKGAEWDAAHPDFGKGMSFTDRGNLFTGGQAARTGELGIEGAVLGNKSTQLGLDRGQWDFGNAKTDRADGLAAQSFIEKFRSGGNIDPSMIDADPGFQSLSLPARALVRNSLGMGGGGAPGGGSGGGFGGGFGAPVKGAPTNYDTVLGNGAYAPLPDKPLTSMSMGEVYDYGQNVLRPGAKAKGIGVMNGQVVGSSAVGMYQLVGPTLQSYAQKLYGNNWRQMQFTPEVQDNIAKSIFMDNRGSPQALMQQWTSLSPAEAKALVGKSWEEAKPQIFRGEANVDPAKLLIGGQLNRQGQNQQYMQQNAGNPLAAAIGDGSVMRDTQPLAPVSGWFAKKYAMPTDRAATMIQGVQAQARAQGLNLNPRAAALILEQSLGPNKYFFKEGNFLGTPNDVVNKDWVADPKLVSSNIASLKTGDYQKQQVANTSNGAQTQNGLFLEQRYRAAGAEVQRLEMRRSQGLPVDPQLYARAQNNFRQYGNAYDAFLKQSNSGLAAGGYLGSRVQAAPPPPPKWTPPPIGADRAPGWFARSGTPGYRPPVAINPFLVPTKPVGPLWPSPVKKR